MIIKKLTLFSKNLQQQKIFYAQVLGFKLLSETKISFEVQTGFSILKFEQNDEFQPYHIAFGIPYSLYTSALKWLEHRVKIQTDNGDKIVDFSAWNAKAIYFYDADKNICEFIARQDLPNTSANIFDINQVYNIVEIGLVTNDIEPIFETLQQATKIPKYDGNFQDFLAIGNFQGLFICINKIKKTWFPTNDEAMISDFKMNAEIEGLSYQILYQNGKLNIV